ncbi:MAG: TorF family putative porin [Xanthomonadales bacterium]|nr:TorF family putative porin [Xanthomonadales bacterium]
MQYKVLVVAIMFSLVATAANADLSGTITITSDYDYRGFTQSAESFALQGSVDYTHENGFYASVWGSSLDFGRGSDADLEVDLVVGFSKDIGDSGINWDIGFIEYLYPGVSGANFGELYGGFGVGGFSVKLSYSNDFAGLGNSAWYLDGGYSHEWDNGWSALVYGGYSYGEAFSFRDGLAFGNTDYFNYGAGLGYNFKQLYVEAKIVGTNLSGSYEIDNGVFANDLRVAFSATLSIP